MLPTKYRFIWPSGFGEDLKKSSNQKQELPVVAMFVNRSGQNEQYLERTFHGCFLPGTRLVPLNPLLPHYYKKMLFWTWIVNICIK